MRLSVDSGDPGYAVWLALHKRNVAPVVTVDGVEVRHCITADTKRGIVVAADLDEKGRPQLNSRRDAVKLRTVTGRVDIEIEGAGYCWPKNDG